MRIVPIRIDFLGKVRITGLDDQGQVVEYLVAKGGEPCRDVLRGAFKGEPIILASYCPFIQSGPYKEYGPVFILAEDSTEAPDFDCLPITTGKVSDYWSDAIVLKAYSRSEKILDAKYISSSDAASIAHQFFDNCDVDFVMARYAAYGCYSLRLER